jgi:hypothetical protein
MAIDHQSYSVPAQSDNEHLSTFHPLEPNQRVCWPEALNQIRISDLAFLAQMGFLFCTDGVYQTPTDG